MCPGAALASPSTPEPQWGLCCRAAPGSCWGTYVFTSDVHTLIPPVFPVSLLHEVGAQPSGWRLVGTSPSAPWSSLCLADARQSASRFGAAAVG